MPPTIEGVGRYTREDRRRVSRWLGVHLPEARRRARGVTPEEAAAGVPANPVTGAREVEAVGVSPRTLRNIETAAKVGESYAPQEAQIELILRWVRAILGYGPEVCMVKPCEVCGAAHKQGRDRSGALSPAERRSGARKT